MFNRRSFLKEASLVSLTPWLPAFLPRSLQAASSDRDGRILVVIQLDGGNDGLNTVVPFAEDAYLKARPTLRIAAADALKLKEGIGLNPGMKGARDLFGDGRLAIIQGVGYPNPNRSHFESLSIWHHARLDETEQDSIGWLGRACDERPVGDGSPDAISLGKEAIPVAVRGTRALTVAMDSESDLHLSVPVEARSSSAAGDDVASFVKRTLTSSHQTAERFRETSKRDAAEGTSFPNSPLGQHLKLISRMIQSDSGARLYYTVHPGFDTHSAQQYTHRRRLGEFSAGLKAFLDDLRAAKLEDRVLVVAFSEFGRRVEENDSEGTDHGAAGPVFVAGAPVKGGLYGEHPSLTDLDDGDLKSQFDFRQVYATLLDRWLGIPSSRVLRQTFEPVPFV